MSCKHCDFIDKTFEKCETATDREYWLMTEVFMYLHDNKDYCEMTENDS